ncbi:hypothetical protein PanWU01x14_200040, partial [Parasponia andersonii]
SWHLPRINLCHPFGPMSNSPQHPMSRGRDRRRSLWPDRRTRAPPLRSQSGGFRARRPSGWRLGLHYNDRVRPNWAGPTSNPGPLEPLPLPSQQPPQRSNGFSGLPVCGQGVRGERSEKVSGSQRGVDVLDRLGQVIWDSRVGEV